MKLRFNLSFKITILIICIAGSLLFIQWELLNQNTERHFVQSMQNDVGLITKSLEKKLFLF